MLFALNDTITPFILYVFAKYELNTSAEWEDYDYMYIIDFTKQ